MFEHALPTLGSVRRENTPDRCCALGTGGAVSNCPNAFDFNHFINQGFEIALGGRCIVAHSK